MKQSTKYLAICLTIFYLLVPISANSQMFSVQPQRQQSNFNPDVAVNIGLSFMNFAYRGSESVGISPSNGLSQNNNVGQTFEFAEPLYHISVDMVGFSAYGLFGRSLGNFSNSYSQVGASIGNNIGLITSSAFRLLLPVKLSSDYIIVRNNDIFANQEFKQNTFGIHSGIEMRARLSQKVRFLVSGSGGYSFSVSGFGNSGGTATDLGLKNKLYFDAIFRQYGLAIGIELHSRKYELDDKRYDHLATQQSITLGITF